VSQSESELNPPPLEMDGSLDLFRVRDVATGQDFALRLGTKEQLERLQADMMAQHEGYQKQAIELLSKAANALSGANIIQYELDRRVNAALSALRANGAANEPH
jgi:hypothetical protein